MRRTLGKPSYKIRREARVSSEMLSIYTENNCAGVNLPVLQSKVNNFYDSLPWVSRLVLRAGLKKPPIQIEACEEVLRYKGLEDKTVS